MTKKVWFLTILAGFIFCNTQLLAQENTQFRAEPERKHALIDTKLKVGFDIPKELLHGEAWIKARPFFYSSDSITLDAKAFLIHEVSLVNGNNKTPLKYSYDQWKLRIALGKTYTREQDFTLYIKYTAQPNKVQQEGSAAISDAKGLYFVNPRKEIPNKPTQIWTQGETEASSAWFPTIDDPNQKTTQEIAITVPDKYVTLSNGTLISQTNNRDNTRTDLWRQTQPHAPYLFYMGIGDFAVVNDTWNGKKIDYYVEHEYAPYAKEIFGMTGEMLEFYSQKFGYEYPWDKYAQMVCRDYVSGAMENTTAVIHMDRAQQKGGQLEDENVWEDVIAHEIAHHWFGNLVTTESWSNLTLNESFANYSEYLWREHKYGKDHADAHRWENLQGYFMGDHYDKNLVRYHYHTREDMFDAVSYNKGGYILHMLRNHLGDDAFFTGLKNYLKQFEYGKAEAHDLRLTLENTVGQDLNWFFDQWYFGHGHPKVTVVTEKKGDNIEVNLRQTQGDKLFTFPLTIDVYVNGKRQRHKVWVQNTAVNTYSFPARGNVDVVVVNADAVALMEITENKRPSEYIAQYKLAKDDYTARMLALDGIAQFQLQNPDVRNLLVEALNDPYFGLREKAAGMLDITDSRIRSIAENKLVELANKDDKTLVRAAALEQLAKLKDDKHMSLFQNGIKARSFAVQAASINGIMGISPSAAEPLIDGLDTEVIKNSPQLVGMMIPRWRAANDTTHMAAMVEMAAFYAFMQYQDPKLVVPSEQAFEWIMTTDSPAETAQIAKLYEQLTNQLKTTQPMAVTLIKNMADRALRLKSETYRKNPSASLQQQVELLSNTKEKINQ
ncbi:MAG: M1 family metallopeptidase [Weeksellaceae bacterium]|nr:M1 family metallopeptidase [Weeksellaceae bacterium]